MSVYLESLTQRLADGAARLDADYRARHGRFLKGEQNADGGFRGRSPESDLYYTGFALRGLTILGELDLETARRAAAYLRGQLQGRATIIDFLSLLYAALLLQVSTGIDLFEGLPSDWPEKTAATLEALRRPDGGYAKSAEGAVGSTYHSFLVVLCLQLLGRTPPEPAKLAAFILAQRREDGGFVEIVAMKRSGTNPTAAAIALLRILDALAPDVRSEAGGFLLDQQNGEGGLQANSRIVVADVLSTFTGMLTLADLDWLDELDLLAVARYLRSMELPAGGYRGAELDPECDVEYTFYGLGAAALLAGRTAPATT